MVAAVTAAVTMPGGGGAPPGTPSAKLKVNIPLIEPSLPLLLEVDVSLECSQTRDIDISGETEIQSCGSSILIQSS